MTDDVTYERGFVPAPDELLARLRADLRPERWDTRMRARLTASFGVPYDYSQLTYARAPWPAALALLRDRIEARVGHELTSCLTNFYEDGTRTMGWHSDSEPAVAAGSTIAIVSRGASRTLEFRPKGATDAMRSFALETGSLLLMAPGLQQVWQHRLPAAPGAGGPISLTFRRIVGSPG